MREREDKHSMQPEHVPAGIEFQLYQEFGLLACMTFAAMPHKKNWKVNAKHDAQFTKSISCIISSRENCVKLVVPKTAVIAVVSTPIDFINFSAITQAFSGKSGPWASVFSLLNKSSLNQPSPTTNHAPIHRTE